MQQLKEKLIEDPINGGKFCYETELYEGVKQWISLSSGFWTNSLMIRGSQFYNEQIEKLPELYKDLAWEDPNTKLIWLPQIVNIPDKGMVFCNGPSSSDWGWSAVKAIEVKEEEKEKYPIPDKKGQYYKMRMDMTTQINFPKDEFMNGLNYIGIFKND